MCNSAFVSSEASDPRPSNNHAIDCNKVRTLADLEVCKSDGVSSVVSGDGRVYTYDIEVANNGPSCAQRVQLVDHIDGSVTLLPSSLQTTQGVCELLNQTRFSCNLLTLAPGQVRTP